MSTALRYPMEFRRTSPQQYDTNRPASMGPRSPRMVSEAACGGYFDSWADAQERGEQSFWSPPSTPATTPFEGPISRVSTGMRMSLNGEEADLDEFRKQARKLRLDLRGLSKYTGKYTWRRSRGSTPIEEEVRSAPAQMHWNNEPNFRRCVAVKEGRGFLQDFLRCHFEEYLEHIQLKCDMTLDEIKMIGNEERAVGVRQCRRLFNAPVISDQIGLLLWEELRKGDSLDHSHEGHFDEDSGEKVSGEEVRRRRESEAEHLKTEWLASQRQNSAGSVVEQVGAQLAGISLVGPNQAGKGAKGAVTIVTTVMNEPTTEVRLEKGSLWKRRAVSAAAQVTPRYR